MAPTGALEVGSEVWVPCQEEVWRLGTITGFEEASVQKPSQCATPVTKQRSFHSPANSPRFQASPSPRLPPSASTTPRKVLAATKPTVDESQIESYIVVQASIPSAKSSSTAPSRGVPKLALFEEIRVPRILGKGAQDLHLRNEVLKDSSGALMMPDLGQLPLLHEPAVLQALQLRFEADVVYTLSGPMLLAVNPFKALPNVYGQECLAAFVKSISTEKPQSNGNESGRKKVSEDPHIYAIARAAYQGVWHRGLGQTVLVSGESGAGKTETTKFVMRFLALAGAGGAESSMSTVERQVLDSIPVLEALGNAKTLRNENSSRFGKYIDRKSVV